MSMMSAPSAIIALGMRDGGCRIEKLAAVGKRIRGDVEDAHDERAVLGQSRAAGRRRAERGDKRCEIGLRPCPGPSLQRSSADQCFLAVALRGRAERVKRGERVKGGQRARPISR